MCDKELLVGYLYDDIDDEGRRRLEAHLAGCDACRDELAALRATRRGLASWSPPESRLDFRIVSGSAAAPRSFRVSPLWGLAAAAVLVLAAASALANIELRYGPEGFTVRTGWGRAAAPRSSPAQVATPQPQAVPADWQATMETLQRRVAELERERQQPAAVVQASAPRLTGQDMRRVQDLLTESESRQKRELALRIGQLALELEAQRRADLTAIQQRMVGATGAERASHEQLWNYVNGLYRVSQQVK